MALIKDFSARQIPQKTLRPAQIKLRSLGGTNLSAALKFSAQFPARNYQRRSIEDKGEDQDRQVSIHSSRD